MVHHHDELPQLKRGHNVFKVKPMVHHHDELPQTVQVAKILAAQELIIWPRGNRGSAQQLRESRP